jgi:hypothetical protein
MATVPKVLAARVDLIHHATQVLTAPHNLLNLQKIVRQQVEQEKQAMR